MSSRSTDDPVYVHRNDLFLLRIFHNVKTTFAAHRAEESRVSLDKRIIRGKQQCLSLFQRISNYYESSCLKTLYGKRIL